MTLQDLEVKPEYRRGDIYYIKRNDPPTETGSEKYAGRPAIIVSNDKANANAKVLEVVYLTTQEKAPIPVHVEINSSSLRSTALCETVYSFDISRFGDYVGHCTPSEMAAIDSALKISLGLNEKPKTVTIYRRIINMLLDELEAVENAN